MPRYLLIVVSIPSRYISIYRVLHFSKNKQHEKPITCPFEAQFEIRLHWYLKDITIHQFEGFLERKTLFLWPSSPNFTIPKNFKVNLKFVWWRSWRHSNHHRSDAVKKTFKKFLESIIGSGCEYKCIICEVIHILKSSEFKSSDVVIKMFLQ